MNGLMLLLALALLLLLQSFVLRRFAFKKLTYERRFSRLACFEGEESEMVEVIRNRKLLPLPWLRAQSRINTTKACST